MLITADTLTRLGELFGQQTRGWYGCKAQVEELLLLPHQEHHDIAHMITSFSKVDTLPRNKVPHYTLLFYIALVILAGGEVSVIKNNIPKTHLTFLVNGLKIFLSGKSKSLTYHAEMSDDRFQNKYEFVSRWADNVFEYEIQLSAWLKLLEIVKSVRIDSYYELLSKDSKKAFFITCMTDFRVQHQEKYLIHFLGSNDEIQSNAAFFYIANRFNPPETVSYLKQVMPETRINLILNYLFCEPRIPGEFLATLVQEKHVVITERLQRFDVTNLYQLVRVLPILRVKRFSSIAKLFVESFTRWMAEDGNPHIWQSTRESVAEIYRLLGRDLQCQLVEQLSAEAQRWFVTDFDRQVRYSKYLKDEQKSFVYQDFLALNK